MSILLDAVTRDKQQSQAVQHDVVLTPRAPYSERRNEQLIVKRTVIFVSLFTAAIVLAWLLSQLLMPRSSEVVGKPLQASPAIPQTGVTVEATADESSFDASGIKLAGKVALPLAKAMPMTDIADAQRPVAAVSIDSTSQAKVAVTAKSEEGDLLAALLKVQQSVESEQAAVETPTSASIEPEPIILGANSNQRGQDMLASLKYEVELAAADVGLDASPKTEDNNNLLAAFEAALKEVERENSVATPVTQAELDPIPTTPKSDSIPKYGQLPAGLQLQVPEFNINAHVYSSVADNRWLNVDGKELQQGDMIQGKLTVVEIRPRDVVLSIQGTEFKVPAI